MGPAGETGAPGLDGQQVSHLTECHTLRNKGSKRFSSEPFASEGPLFE